jgi:hypothetical protein
MAITPAAGIGFGVQVLGSLIGAGGQTGADKAQAELLQERARLDRFNAKLIRTATAQKVGRGRKAGERFLGAQRAQIGATGLASGDFASIVAETAGENELDILAVMLEGETAAFEKEAEAEAGERAARQVRKASRRTLLGTGLGLVGAGIQTFGGK